MGPGLPALAPADQQHAFNKVLSRLIESDGDWATNDYELQAAGDFQISAVLWALYIGPSGIINGLAAGVGVLSILMGAEEFWFSDNDSTPNYEHKVKILEGFTDSLRQWGCALAAD